MSVVSCVVFDVDDTLYLERDYVLSGMRAVGRWVLENMGIAGFETIAVALFEAGLRGRVFDEALCQLGADPNPQIVHQLVRVYRNHSPEIRMLPDASECLKSLCGRCRLAGITGGPPESQRQKVHALGLDGILSPLVLAGQWGSVFDKPHTRAFELVEMLTSHRFEQCVYVADNPLKDFVAPKQLGWRTIRVRRPSSLHAEVESGLDVDIEQSNLNSLTDILAGWCESVESQ